MNEDHRNLHFYRVVGRLARLMRELESAAAEVLRLGDEDYTQNPADPHDHWTPEIVYESAWGARWAVQHALASIDCVVPRGIPALLEEAEDDCEVPLFANGRG